MQFVFGRDAIMELVCVFRKRPTRRDEDEDEDETRAHLSSRDSNILLLLSEADRIQALILQRG